MYILDVTGHQELLTGAGDIVCNSNAGQHQINRSNSIAQNQVFIEVRIVFLKLGKIDTGNEKFAADAFVQAKWRDPTQDGEAKDIEIESDLPSRPNFWDPRLYVTNALGQVTESIWYVTSFNHVGQATVYQRRRIKGTFFEQMELNQFPFDTQELTLTLSTERGEFELELNSDESEISTVNVQSFVDEQEWNLYKHISTWKKVTTNAYKSSKHKHPALNVSCTATRKSPFFLWNIVLVMIFICTLIFTTFTVKEDLPQNRIQLSLILLLSTITFKLTVSQTLPKVSYLTYLDKFILTSMAILCLVCFWHAIVSMMSLHLGVKFAKGADCVAFYTFMCLYVLFNTIFLGYSRFMVMRRAKLYHHKDMVHQERVRSMEVLASPGWNKNDKPGS